MFDILYNQTVFELNFPRWWSSQHVWWSFNRHCFRDTSSVKPLRLPLGDSTKVEATATARKVRKVDARCHVQIWQKSITGWWTYSHRETIGKPINQLYKEMAARSVMAGVCFHLWDGRTGTYYHQGSLNPVNKWDDPPSSVFFGLLFSYHHFSELGIFLQLNHDFFMVRPPFSRSPFSQLHQNFS